MKRIGYLDVVWELFDDSGVPSHCIYLECKGGWGPTGKWWSGAVKVVRIDGPNLPPVIIASQRLLDPWGMSRGDEARKKTRRYFCEWASKFSKTIVAK